MALSRITDITPQVIHEIQNIFDEIESVLAPGGGSGLGDPGGNGILVRTALGVTDAVELVPPAAGFTIANPTGVSGGGGANPTFTLANDLAAVEGLSTTGVVKRTGADAWSAGALVAGDIPDLSGTYVADPMTTLGDLIYGGASGVSTRLAGHTVATTKYLTQTGNGSASAAPVWSNLDALVNSENLDIGMGDAVLELSDATLTANLYAGTVNIGRTTGDVNILGAVSLPQYTSNGFLKTSGGDGTLIVAASAIDVSVDLAFTASQSITVNDAATTAFTDLAALAHNSSGTPATNFGGSILFKLESSTTANQDAVRVGALWVDAVHATRLSAFVIQTVDSGAALSELARFAPDQIVFAAGLAVNGQLQGEDAFFDSVEVGGQGVLTDASVIGATKGGTGLTALGSANQLLRVNAGATALEYFTPTFTTAGVNNNFTAAQTITVNDTVTNTFTDLLSLIHNSTGTPAANFGGSVLFKLESSTTVDQDAARIGASWEVATHASRTGQVLIQTVTNAGALETIAAFGGGVAGISLLTAVTVDGVLTVTNDIACASVEASGNVAADAVLLHGSTSGLITIIPAAIAGTWTLTLPTNDGDANQSLITNGSGVTSWASVVLASAANTFTAAQTITINDAATNTFTDLAVFGHNSTGSPAANFGGSLLFKLESSTTADQDAARIGAIWTTATHASRTSAFVIQTVESGGALAESARFTNGGLVLTGYVSAGSVNTAEVTATGAAFDILVVYDTLLFNGSTSGQVTVQVPAVAGTWTLTLPTTDGTSGQVLTTDGDGITSWTTVTGGGGASLALDNLASVAINASLLPGTSDAVALGSTTKQWSDLFLAEGGVINWDNGDATITQTGNVLAIAGAVVTMDSDLLNISNSSTLSHFTGESVIQLGGNMMFITSASRAAGNSFNFAQNAYFAAVGGWTYISTDEATNYQQTNGIHKFMVAVSGTAGTSIASFATAMTITNEANLKIAGTAIRGTTEGTNHLDIFNGTAPAGTLANGVSLFSASGKLKSADAAGLIGHVLSASAANVVSPTAPNRTLTVDVGGTTYYIAAKTTND